MPPRKEVDYKTLLKMVNDGVPQAEIMAELGFKNATQLKVALANAAMAEGRLPALVGGRGAGSAARAEIIRVNKRGSLVIPKDKVEAFGFAVGDEFTLRRVNYGLQVRKAGEEAEGEE